MALISYVGWPRNGFSNWGRNLCLAVLSKDLLNFESLLGSAGYNPVIFN